MRTMNSELPLQSAKPTKPPPITLGDNNMAMEEEEVMEKDVAARVADAQEES